MTSAVQHRKGTTAEHATFTGLEGEVTIDTTKDTAVIHDGSTVGGFPLAKENLANFSTSGLSTIDGASTASDDKFLIYDQSATSLKTITRAELNNAMEQDALANVAITGGTIDGTTIGGTTPAAITGTTITANTSFAGALNGTVGATTPASGAFTTLTTSSTVTHNGGTANGVAYLNGSKALTTGSALTFDGSTFAVSAAVTGDSFKKGISGNFIVGGGSGGTTYLDSGTATDLVFRPAGTEGMRLTSTGLGIGTSSPATKLHIYTASATGTYLRSENTAGFLYTGVKSSGVGYVATESNTALELGTNGTVRATLDSLGNLGLGVTPSAWVAGSRGFQVGAYTALSQANGGDSNLTNNAYLSATGVYTAITSLGASRYTLDFGAHRWYTASSGTAGNAISFTQAMTLDASGNLGVGTTSPSYRFDAVGSSGSISTIRIRNGSTGASDGAQILLGNSANFTNAYFRLNGGGNTSQAGAGSLNIGLVESAPMAFYTANTERARITSSGELLVGTTTPVIGKMTVNGGITTTGYPQFNMYSTNSSTQFEWVLRSGTQQQFYVNNATVFATLTSSGVWTNASDVRYKENIRPVAYGLSEVLQLQPRAYNIIGSDKEEIGFVAQEVEPILPELVQSVTNSVTEEERLTLSYGQMSAVIVKAIQEQQAIIEQLKARLDAANL